MKSTKKQIIIVFAILTMALVLSCAFVACDKVEPDKTGTDIVSEYKVTIHPNNGQGDIVWDITKAIPTITKDGFHIAGYFLDAQLTISTTLESLKATGITKNIDVYVKWAKHDYKDGVCIVCGIRRPSEGLKYSWNSDEKGYTVTGIGTCTDKELIIPSEYKAKPVTSIGYSAFSDTGLTSITIPDSVTSIGGSAFEDCTGLTSIYYTGDVASWCGISGLGNLMSSSRTLYIDGNKVEGELIISDSVTSIGNSAFSGCTGLTSVTIPDSVTSIGDEAFYNTAWYNNQPGGLVYAGKVAYKYKGTMPSNTSIVLKEGTLGIAGSAFFGCTGLTSVTIPDSVTSIGERAFADCDGLTSITVAKGNTKYHSAQNCLIETESKTLIAGCKNSIIPTDGSVTSIDWGAFSGCKGLTSVTIGKGVTSIDSSAFSGCTGLTSVTIPNGVKAIPSSAFRGCTGLTSVIIPDSVTSIGGDAFYNTLWYNKKPDGLVYAGKVAYKYKGTMPSNTSIVLNEGTLGIAGSAFSGCTGLTSITIPDSVTSIGERAFADCTGLTSITVAKGNTKYHSAQNCLIETESKTLIAGCKNSIIPTDGSVISIGREAFAGCTGLTSVTIPDSVTSIGYEAFQGCTGLTSITIPDSVTRIGDDAFYYCTGLTNIKFNGTIEQWNAISKGYYWNNQVPATQVICRDGTISI